MDDASDYTDKQKKRLTRLLESHIVIHNTTRKFSVRNAYDAIHQFVPDDAIIVNVDGDDWLNNTNALQYIADIYNESKCLLTYGGHINYMGEKKDLTGLPIKDVVIPKRYAKACEQGLQYRKEFFLPIHLRTWSASLFKRIKQSDLKRPNGEWLQFCEDQAFFFPMLEMSDGRYQVTTEVTYTYNLSTNLSDHILYRKHKLLDELCIRSKPVYKPLHNA